MTEENKDQEQCTIQIVRHSAVLLNNQNNEKRNTRIRESTPKISG